MKHFMLVILIIPNFIYSLFYPVSSEDLQIKYNNGICKLSRCLSFSLCSSHSTCNEETGTCKCFLGFTSKKDDGVVNCCYAQKAKYRAFIMEFCFGFGIGHKYIGNEKASKIKCIVYSSFLVCIIGFLTEYNMNKSKEPSFKVKFIRTLFTLLAGCVFICWQIVDGVMIMFNGYTDQNGIELADMF